MPTLHTGLVIIHARCTSSFQGEALAEVTDINTGEH
jgi:hypothetical protein